MIGTGSFVDGTCSFTGLAGVTLEPEAVTHFFVEGDMSPTGAADGDVIAIEISDALDAAPLSPGGGETSLSGAMTFAHHSAGGPVATNWDFAPDPELARREVPARKEATA